MRSIFFHPVLSQQSKGQDFRVFMYRELNQAQAEIVGNPKHQVNLQNEPGDKHEWGFDTYK